MRMVASTKHHSPGCAASDCCHSHQHVIWETKEENYRYFLGSSQVLIPQSSSQITCNQPDILTALSCPNLTLYVHQDKQCQEKIAYCSLNSQKFLVHSFTW